MKKGFTLMELMVVIAIIGILVAVLLPQFASFQDKARTAQILSYYDSVRTACSAYRSDVGLWPYHNIRDGAYWQLVNNPRGVSNWQGPYIDRPPTRSDGRVTNPFGGRMMLYDVDNGYGDNPWNFNGGASPDRHLILEGVPQSVRDRLQIALDGRDDGNRGRVAEFWGNWVALTFSEGS